MSLQFSYLFIHNTGEPYYVNKALRKLDKQDVNKVKMRKSYKSVLTILPGWCCERSQGRSSSTEGVVNFGVGS